MKTLHVDVDFEIDPRSGEVDVIGVHLVDRLIAKEELGKRRILIGRHYAP